jgi:hypothetical protein
MTSIRPKLLIRAAFITAILLSAESALAQFLQQGPKLVGTGAVGNAGQGYSVALSGDGNTGIFGGPGDNSGAGTAWISTRSNGVWSQQGAKLVATDPGLGPGQGASVALSADGKTVIVGGPGDTNANTGENTGAAWIYTLVNGVWTQQGPKLIGTDLTGYPVSEGASVALSADGNTAIIGGNGDNGSTGAAWIFTRSNGVWSQQGDKLVGSGAVGLASQGRSVALSADGNTAILGGPGDNSSIGAAWVFTRSNGVWSQQGGKLVGSGVYGPYAEQGWSVALSADGNTAIVGGQDDNLNTGAAWVFTRSNGVWTQQGNKLVGTGFVGSEPMQGWSVAL